MADASESLALPPSPAPDDEGRHVSPYTLREKAGRMLWAMTQATLFRWSFHTWYGWRGWLLRRFGARIDRSARVRRTARIECPWNLALGPNSSLGDFAIAYCLGPVTLGRRVSVSQYAHLCAGSHDYTQRDMPLLRPPIVIEDDAWIAADAFVGPGVRVGRGAILGARGVALKSLSPWWIYLGNPAQKVKPRTPYSTEGDVPSADGEDDGRPRGPTADERG